MNITDLGARALSAAIRAGELSCVETMRATLDRIAAVNPRANAIVNLQDGDALLRQAGERDAQLRAGRMPGGGPIAPLHGVPQAVKDLANAAGIPTTLGSPLMRDFIPRDDGLMAARMKAAGCIVVGKTNVPEFGLGSHTFNEVFGATPNPYDPKRSAGGSSGGAAAALALRLLPVADGSDFMGSLRNPAAWNNVFGLRPSQGRVPTWPAPDAWVAQLGTDGPMGRSVADLALLLDVQAGHDPRAPLSIAGRERFDGPLGGSIDPAAVRIGWLGDLDGHLATEPGILDTCGEALRRLEGIGCRVDPVVRPGFSPAAVWQTWLVWRRWLVAARIAPFLLNPKSRARIKPEALWEHDQAQGLTGAQVLTASIERTTFLHAMLALFERHDVLALPCTQVWPFDVAQRWPQRIDGREMDTYHRWMEVTIYATLAGLPGISVPAGFNSGGLPTGLQLIGGPHADLNLLRLAHAYEQAAQDVLAVRPREPVAGGAAHPDAPRP